MEKLPMLSRRERLDQLKSPEFIERALKGSKEFIMRNEALLDEEQKQTYREKLQGTSVDTKLYNWPNPFRQPIWMPAYVTEMLLEVHEAVREIVHQSLSPEVILEHNPDYVVNREIAEAVITKLKETQPDGTYDCLLTVRSVTGDILDLQRMPYEEVRKLIMEDQAYILPQLLELNWGDNNYNTGWWQDFIQATQAVLPGSKMTLTRGIKEEHTEEELTEKMLESFRGKEKREGMLGILELDPYVNPLPTTLDSIQRMADSIGDAVIIDPSWMFEEDGVWKASIPMESTHPKKGETVIIRSLTSRILPDDLKTVIKKNPECVGTLKKLFTDRHLWKDNLSRHPVVFPVVNKGIVGELAKKIPGLVPKALLLTEPRHAEAVREFLEIGMFQKPIVAKRVDAASAVGYVPDPKPEDLEEIGKAIEEGTEYQVMTRIPVARLLPAPNLEGVQRDADAALGMGVEFRVMFTGNRDEEELIIRGMGRINFLPQDPDRRTKTDALDKPFGITNVGGIIAALLALGIPIERSNEATDGPGMAPIIFES